MRGARTATAIAILGATFVGGISAFGSTTPSGGMIQVFATPSTTNEALSSILITGAVGDYGQALSIDKNGKTDANGNYVKVTLQKGTFEINSTMLNQKTNNAQPTINKTTCSFSLSANGPVTIFNGTGLYKGISGTANITITFAAYGPLLTSGKNKGQCNTSQNAQPTNQYASITGPGTVKFS